MFKDDIIIQGGSLSRTRVDHFHKTTTGSLCAGISTYKDTFFFGNNFSVVHEMGTLTLKECMDDGFSDALKKRWYVVARRTVAKYRDLLGIPKWSQRRNKKPKYVRKSQRS